MDVSNNSTVAVRRERDQKDDFSSLVPTSTKVWNAYFTRLGFRLRKENKRGRIEPHQIL